MNRENPQKDRSFYQAATPLLNRGVGKLRASTPEAHAAATDQARARRIPPSPPRVGIIGAGCCGLVALKALREVGLSATVFEMGGDVGGLWVLGNSNGRGGAYRSLHINTSTEAMQFSDFPLPTDIGKFPHHRHIATYFARYAEHFGLLDSIRFQSEVTSCHLESQGGYRVSVLDRMTGHHSEHQLDALIVANGHHWSAAYPDPNPAQGFSGTTFHSHRYVDPTTPEDLTDKDVVIVGMGNSAVDIACELARVGGARSVTLAARRGVWVLPKFLLGKPIDQGTLIPRWLPDKWRRTIATWGFEKIYGKMTDFGLPQPDHRIGEAHPTISSELPFLVSNGDIRVKRELVRCSGSQVHFACGHQQKADAIIFATGYDIAFPFLEPSHIRAVDNQLPLYLRAFHLEHRQVFFVGLMQTIGAVMPAAEIQARLIARHLSGDYNLPEPTVMRDAVNRQERKMKKRFVPSRRHTMQIIPEEFIPQVQAEIRQGSKRARRGLGLAFDYEGLHGRDERPGGDRRDARASKSLHAEGSDQ